MLRVFVILAVFTTVAAQPAPPGPGRITGPTCGVGQASSNSKVLKFSDGQNDRCISVIWPASAAPSSPIPVLFWFHGHRGNAAHCDQHPLAPIAQQNGFALVCGEAIQYQGQGGSGNMPKVITDATGTPCNDTDTVDVPYIKNALSELAAMDGHKGLFDLTRIFYSGCSQGSGFSTYISTCTKQNPATTAHLSAFATHSTGLKIKGDGIKWDCCSNIESCAACQYFPAKPVAYKDHLGLKACIFDNYQDQLPPGTNNPFFYLSSKELASHWTKLGNRAETHFADGTHCEIHSYEAIVKCLDDGTGRLLHNSSLLSYQ